MEHIFNIAINIEDDRIRESIEKNVEANVTKMISDKVENIICNRNWGGTVRDYKPLENMIHAHIDESINKHKGVIIATASEKLADKLFRSKAAKEMLAAKLEEV